MALMDDNCSYHDTIYAEPFDGKDAIRGYFTKVKDILGPSLLFVVENTSGGGGSSPVGVKWCEALSYGYARDNWTTHDDGGFVLPSVMQSLAALERART